MNVLTVEKLRGQLVVTKYKSEKAFLAANGNSWCHEKFLKVLRSSDLENYEFSYEPGMVVYTTDQIAAHNMLHGIYLTKYKGI